MERKRIVAAIYNGVTQAGHNWERTQLLWAEKSEEEKKDIELQIRHKMYTHKNGSMVFIDVDSGEQLDFDFKLFGIFTDVWSYDWGHEYNRIRVDWLNRHTKFYQKDLFGTEMSLAKVRDDLETFLGQDYILIHSDSDSDVYRMVNDFIKSIFSLEDNPSNISFENCLENPHLGIISKHFMQSNTLDIQLRARFIAHILLAGGDEILRY